ncbi:MAG: hypothetical protein AD742_00870 [Methylibium sp. NZG]|nr:MAG: hypothetical protein AD742_00870 [Methylibium sp. NZG]
MKLTPRGQAEVADTRRLSTDSKAEVVAAWEAEISRRIRQIDSGEVGCISWEIVMVKLRAKFG